MQVIIVNRNIKNYIIKQFIKRKVVAKNLMTDKRKRDEVLDDVDRKLKSMGPDGPLSGILDDVKILFKMIKYYFKGLYRDVPKGTIITVLASLMYFLSPLDSVSDIIPVLGFLDDAFIFGLVIRQVEREIVKFRVFLEENE